MTEEEKFYEEVDKRTQEIYEMPDNKREELLYELVEKYEKMFGAERVWDYEMYRALAEMEVAIKMGKSVYEITGEDYDPYDRSVMY